MALPRFTPAVPLQTPEYLALGTPTDEYPSSWSVLDWIEGENATQASLSDLSAAAERLGEFVLALRAIGWSGAPHSHHRDNRYQGRGRALYMCIAGISHYLDTNPGFVVVARRALTRMLNTWTVDNDSHCRIDMLDHPTDSGVQSSG